MPDYMGLLQPLYPVSPEPDRPLRMAKCRLQVAIAALDEAISDPAMRGAGFELALENIEEARKALVVR